MEKKKKKLPPIFNRYMFCIKKYQVYILNNPCESIDI